jgi:outer membrane protein assembly factor BamB
MRRNCSALLLLLAITCSATAADWPAFRGPTNDGISTESTAATQWGPEKNVKWKVPLPRPGNGSPIVVANRVFVTSAEDAKGKRRSLYCFNALDGKQIWARTTTVDKVMPTHKTNPYSGTTPLSDGRRVVVWHATGGLKCYDLDGKELWSRNLGEFKHTWGYGTSPILLGENLILHSGPGRRVFVTAITMATGKTVWETDEPIEVEGLKNKNGQYQGSWCTPIVAHIKGKPQVIVAMNTRVSAYDPTTGKVLWTASGMRHARGDLAYSSPVIAGDAVVVTGGYKGPMMAIRLGGSGDVTKSHRIWRHEKQPQSIGSGVFVGGHIYRPNAGPSTIECIDAATGKVTWTERATGNQWASIIKVGDLLYATGQDGGTIVFRANPKKFDVVAKNKLGDSCNATPAVSDGRLYFRTAKHLWCVGE